MTKLGRRGTSRRTGTPARPSRRRRRRSRWSPGRCVPVARGVADREARGDRQPRGRRRPRRPISAGARITRPATSSVAPPTISATGPPATARVEVAAHPATRAELARVRREVVGDQPIARQRAGARPRRPAAGQAARCAGAPAARPEALGQRVDGPHPRGADGRDDRGGETGDEADQRGARDLQRAEAPAREPAVVELLPQRPPRDRDGRSRRDAEHGADRAEDEALGEHDPAHVARRCRRSRRRGRARASGAARRPRTRRRRAARPRAGPRPAISMASALSRRSPAGRGRCRRS